MCGVKSEIFSKKYSKTYFFKKSVKSLETTKKHFKESQSLSGVELKEYSLIYLIINNLRLIQENIHLVDNIKLFTKVNTQIFDKIVSKLKLDKDISLEKLEIDNQLIEKINKFAPIKYILRNKTGDEHEIFELLNDISRDLNNYDLEFRIQQLESKFSEDMSETTLIS